MIARHRFGSTLLAALVASLGIAASGCSQAEDRGPAAKEKPEPRAKSSAPKAHDHSDWWCDEHGIPEAQCSMCSAKFAAKCKKKGDWCEQHDRARSQCFKCDPKLKEKYAALYRAKFGKEPPPIEEESEPGKP